MSVRIIRLFAAFVSIGAALAAAPVATEGATTNPVATTRAASVEQWDIFDLALPGPANGVNGNPFDVKLAATFTSGTSTVDVKGFYDGDGIYRVRFMPSAQGVWKYETASDVPALSGKTGEFTCAKPSPGNHGPVRIVNTFQFAHADGKPFFPFGTTIYGWTQQRSDALQEQTLATLKASPFNRVRMTVLPISYGEDNVPRYFPYEENADDWIFDRFDPRFFRHIEGRLKDLQRLGIEAELVLFHSRGGRLLNLERNHPAVDDRYVRYCIARFSAFRNVTWCLANEFDIMSSTKSDADWDRIFQILAAEDPYQHPRSIHQQRRHYDIARPWITHMSIQSELGVAGFGQAAVFREVARKPVMFDEVQYEGDVPQDWGHLTGEELTHRFWMGVIGGAYVTHGETYEGMPGARWVSNGGKLVGESPKRIAFLKEIIDGAPANLVPIDPEEDDTQGIFGVRGEYLLVYLGKAKRDDWTFQVRGGRLRAGMEFRVDLIDTWNMTVAPLGRTVKLGAGAEGVFPADPPLKVSLGGKPYMALRIQRVPPPASTTRSTSATTRRAAPASTTRGAPATQGRGRGMDDASNPSDDRRGAR